MEVIQMNENAEKLENMLEKYKCEVKDDELICEMDGQKFKIKEGDTIHV